MLHPGKCSGRVVRIAGLKCGAKDTKLINQKHGNASAPTQRDAQGGTAPSRPPAVPNQRQREHGKNHRRRGCRVFRNRGPPCRQADSQTQQHISGKTLVVAQPQGKCKAEHQARCRQRMSPEQRGVRPHRSSQAQGESPKCGGATIAAQPQRNKEQNRACHSHRKSHTKYSDEIRRRHETSSRRRIHSTRPQ